MADRTVKWGHVHEIDRRCKPGSEAWFRRHPTRVQHLSAYRKLHDIADHQEVREYVDASVKSKLKAIKKFESND